MHLTERQDTYNVGPSGMNVSGVSLVHHQNNVTALITIVVCINVAGTERQQQQLGNTS